MTQEMSCTLLFVHMWGQMYDPSLAKMQVYLSTDPPAGPCTHAHPGMASVHCTLVELYVSVKHAFRGRCYRNANKFVTIYCAPHNVFVQMYLCMNPVQRVCSFGVLTWLRAPVPTLTPGWLLCTAPLWKCMFLSNMPFEADATEMPTNL